LNSYLTTKWDVYFINYMKIVEINGSYHSNTYGDGGPLWAVMESDCALVEAVGTADTHTLTQSSFTVIST